MCCMESSVDHDQLASLEASQSGSTLFPKEYVFGFMIFSKEFICESVILFGILGSYHFISFTFGKIYNKNVENKY